MPLHFIAPINYREITRRMHNKNFTFAASGNPRTSYEHETRSEELISSRMQYLAKVTQPDYIVIICDFSIARCIEIAEKSKAYFESCKIQVWLIDLPDFSANIATFECFYSQIKRIAAKTDAENIKISIFCNQGIGRTGSILASCLMLYSIETACTEQLKAMPVDDPIKPTVTYKTSTVCPSELAGYEVSCYPVIAKVISNLRTLESSCNGKSVETIEQVETLNNLYEKALKSRLALIQEDELQALWDEYEHIQPDPVPSSTPSPRS